MNASPTTAHGAAPVETVRRTVLQLALAASLLSLVSCSKPAEPGKQDDKPPQREGPATVEPSAPPQPVQLGDAPRAPEEKEQEK